MSTSTPDKNADIEYDLTDVPEEKATEETYPEDTTFIVHRTPDGEKRMPMSEWPAYAKENGL